MAMGSRASIAGHPIHPMLVVFPIGLFIFSFICDLISLGSADPVWNAVAYYTMAGGIIGGVAAAIPGFVDLFSLPPSRARSVGIVHMSINLIVVALFAINLWTRANAAPDALGPIWLSAIGVVLLAISGWLGGEMVYVHGVGHSHGREHAAPERASAAASRR